jgi:hypothetical protein
MALVKTDVSDECIASIIWVKRISELGTMLAVTSRDDGILLSHRCETLKSAHEDDALQENAYLVTEVNLLPTYSYTVQTM